MRRHRVQHLLPQPVESRDASDRVDLPGPVLSGEEVGQASLEPVTLQALAKEQVKKRLDTLTERGALHLASTQHTAWRKSFQPGSVLGAAQ